jgi:glucosylceramidase
MRRWRLFALNGIEFDATPARACILGAALALATIVVLAAGAPGAARAANRHAGRIEVVQTTASLHDALTRLPDARFSSRRPGHVPVIHVDDRVRYQRVTGVGAAMTDSSAWLIREELPPGAQAKLLRNLFGVAGIRLSFLRLPIGASDFTAYGQPYSYDDLPPGESDPELSHFSIAHDEPYIIPALQAVLRTNPAVRILANPWSPPGWMKANHSLDNSLYLGSLLPAAYRPLADYFVKFIEAYGRQGVPIAAITPQNEPLASVLYPGLALSAPDEAQLIAQYLRPALAAAGLPTKIYGYDAGWESPSYADALISTGSLGALDGIAWHCYSGIPDVMSTVHGLAPALDAIVSECSPGIEPYPVEEVLIGSFRNWASAVALWNLALDPAGGPVQPPNGGCQGCSGVVTIDGRTHRASYNRAYYELGQMSEFVQPGALRIRSEHFVSYHYQGLAASPVTPGLDDVAFLNPDGSRVLVASNTSARRIRFAVEWSGRWFTYRLMSRATVTFVWRPEAR